MYFLFFETTILGKTADLAKVQKTTIDTFHKEGKSQRVITEKSDSLCTALQTKILWINGSLNAIDTIETWVSGEPDCPDGTFAAGYTMARGRGGESCVLRLFPWRTLISTYSEP